MIVSSFSFYQIEAIADPPTESISGNTEKIINSESDKELHVIIDDMFDDLFQRRSENVYVKPITFKFWLQKLKEYKQKNPEDINRVLFLEAECHYRMSNLKRAYAKFYQLKINMESTNDPLHNFVEARLSALNKNIKPTSLTSKPTRNKKLFNTVFAVISILFIILICLIDIAIRKKSQIEDEKYKRRIVPFNKIISLKEMCKQDGRCSEDAVKEYQQLMQNNSNKIINLIEMCKQDGGRSEDAVKEYQQLMQNDSDKIKGLIKSKQDGKCSENAVEEYQQLMQKISNKIIKQLMQKNSNKIISLKKMCEQVGECSENAVEEYQKLMHYYNWEYTAEYKKEKLKFARLIAEGHKMINKINDEIAPYPIKLISRVPLIGNFPLFWRYTISGVILVGSWWLVGFITDMTMIPNGITYFLLAAFVISSLYGIHLMAAKTIDTIDEFICMLEPEQKLSSIKYLQVWIKRLFNNIRQLYFPIIIMGIIIYRLYNNGELILEGKGFNLDIFFIAILVFLTSNLIWFLFGSLVMMKNIFNLKDLSINPLSPSKTIGLEKWISVIGTYNMVCSIVLTFGCSIAVYEYHVKGGDLVQGSMWFFIITPILIFAWIYPYIKIGNLVKSKKMKRMNFIKTKISILFNEWVESEDKILKYTENSKDNDLKPIQTNDDPSVEKQKIKDKLVDMENYYKVFQKIEESPESYFDFNSALELTKVLGIPSLFALVSAFLSNAF